MGEGPGPPTSESHSSRSLVSPRDHPFPLAPASPLPRGPSKPRRRVPGRRPSPPDPHPSRLPRPPADRPLRPSRRSRRVLLARSLASPPMSDSRPGHRRRGRSPDRPPLVAPRAPRGSSPAPPVARSVGLESLSGLAAAGATGTPRGRPSGCSLARRTGPPGPAPPRSGGLPAGVGAATAAAGGVGARGGRGRRGPRRWPGTRGRSFKRRPPARASEVLRQGGPLPPQLHGPVDVARVGRQPRRGPPVGPPARPPTHRRP